MRFRGEFHFLSNFHSVSITGADGRVWPSAEHAYQAMKFMDEEAQETIRRHPAKGLKRAVWNLGPPREDWDQIKVWVMHKIVQAKFDQHPHLRKKLEDVAIQFIVEDNYWHDNFWGSCSCSGCVNKKGWNVLGQILMDVRDGRCRHPYVFEGETCMICGTELKLEEK